MCPSTMETSSEELPCQLSQEKLVFVGQSLLVLTNGLRQDFSRLEMDINSGLFPLNSSSAFFFPFLVVFGSYVLCYIYLPALLRLFYIAVCLCYALLKILN